MNKGDERMNLSINTQEVTTRTPETAKERHRCVKSHYLTIEGHRLQIYSAGSDMSGNIIWGIREIDPKEEAK